MIDIVCLLGEEANRGAPYLRTSGRARDCGARASGVGPEGASASAAGLISEGKAKTSDEIRELMSGNICRCGAYPNIVAAIQQAMERS